jgi:pyruvate-formate lyase-activating enzyme
MKERLRLWYDRLFPQVKHLPAGIFHFQSPPEASQQYRLHLRIDPDGEGTLIINAKTVLHLNQTATEYAFLLVHSTPLEEAAKNIKARYQVSIQEATKDYSDFSERIHTLVHTPDLAPDIYLDFERVDPYSQEMSAPYRLDCALTYKTSCTNKKVAPTDRVKRELTTEEWMSILEKAWTAGIPHVVFTGGEPTLRPDLPELINKAEELGQVSGLITCGDRLSEPKYLHQLLQAGLDHIMIVLDTTDDQALESLRDILVEDIFVNVHLTVTKKNAPNLPQIIDALAEKGVKSFSLSVDDIAQKEKLLSIRNFIASKGLSLVWDLPVPYSQMHPLALELQEHNHPTNGAGKAWLYVEPDGDVLPEQGENHVLGNFLSDTWETIWKNANQK